MNSQKMDTQTCRLLLIENKADLDIKDVSIRDVLNSLMWDGMPRIRSCLHHFLGADESDYVEEMLKHFLLGAIRRVFHPGSKYEELLCLVGGQGAGKSTFFRFLAMLLNKSGKCLAGQGVAPTVYRQFAQYPQNSKPAFLHYALVCMPKAHHICSCVRSPYRFLKFNAATKQPNAPFTLQHIRSAFSHKNL